MKRLVKVSTLLTVMAVLLTGCNCYKKMEKKVDEVRATATPSLLSLRGTTVNTDVTVHLPAKFVQKTAVIRLTPVLVFDNGSIEAAPRFFQGEKVKDNYSTIAFKSAADVTLNASFPWDERAALSYLDIQIDGRCKNGEYQRIATLRVAEGVSTVQKNADLTAYLSIMPDNFRRITTISQEADLVYLINSSQVRPNALNDDQIKLFEEFVRDNNDRYRTTLGNVYAKGYASPDGPVRFNEELSQRRSETGSEAIERRLKDVDINFDAAAYGEDWEGFQKLVQASNMPDKDLILQVLQMYSSPVQRDEQIKNMSQVYDVLKRDILPQLRRTQLLASADIEGKTDDEMRNFLRGDVNGLNLEETLYSATLVDDMELKARAYRSAADRFNDERAYNNYGVILARQGDLEGAKTAISRASAIRSTPEINNNLGAIALAQGNIDEARRYLSPLNSQDAAGNKALIALNEGDYATATRGLDGYNLAVAEFLNGNISQSKAALGNLDTADADYLRAVIAMREGNTQNALTNLRSSVAKDQTMRTRARKDAEFRRLFDNAEFQAI